MIYCIGEALIDMLQDEKTKTFSPYAGGSLANVAACVGLLGGKSALISKLGDDDNGRFLLHTLNNYGVDTSKIFFCNRKTGVIFFSKSIEKMNEVAAQRTFSADRYLHKDQIDDWFDKNSILHFSSICLVEAPVKRAQTKAIKYVLEHNGRLCFDVNYREKIWKDKKSFLSLFWEYAKYADYIKLSQYDYKEISQNCSNTIQKLFEKSKRLKIVIITKGKNGVDAYLRNGYKIHLDAFYTKVVDTIGAGDCFIGCFLYFIDQLKNEPNENQLHEILTFCNAASALHVAKKGAISSLPNILEIKNFLIQNNIPKMEIYKLL